MEKQRNDFLDRLIFFGLRLLAATFHCFPIDVNLQTAKSIGTIWFMIDKRRKERALSNLKHAYPDLTQSQRLYFARKSVQHVFMLVVEVMFTPRLVRIETWRKYVDIDNFQETLRLLMDRDRGLIMLTGHYGNWEILGYVLATLGFETTSVARAMDNPYVSEWVFGVRERHGQKMIYKKGATNEVTDVLDKKGVVCFVADQNAGSKGIFVDFFGRKASTYKSIGLLAMQYQVPIVVGYARRLNARFRFRVATQDIIWPQDWQSQDDPLRYITQRYTSAIETFVREDPWQYMWIHRRWKSRPKGETPEVE